jgi:hypothetical protein
VTSRRPRELSIADTVATEVSLQLGRGIIAGLLILASCSSHTVAGPSADVPDANGHIAFEITDVALGSLTGLPRDPVEIIGARADADTIVIDVRYGGGCTDHAFILLASPTFAESSPVQSSMLLAHEGRGDLCKALVARTLRADVSPLRDAYRRAYQVEHGTIAIQLGGAPRVLYTF